MSQSVSTGMTTMNKIGKTMSAALLLGAALVGCRTGPNYHDVELTPRGASVLRTISRDFGPEDYDAMAALYGIEPDAEVLAMFEENNSVSRRVTGTFTGDMPGDTDNDGTLLYCESPLGSTSWYSERFGGNDDVASMLGDQETAFNEYWDLVLRALESIAGQEPGFAEVRHTLDTVVRRDAWNIALTLSVVDTVSDSVKNLEVVEDDEENEVLMRVVHLADAMGYIHIDRTWDYLARLDDTDSGAAIFEIIGEAVGRKMGLSDDGAIPPVFAKLASFSDSELEEIVDRLIAEEGGEDRFSSLASRAFRFDQNFFAYGGDMLRVPLYVPVEPYWTNGHWNTDSDTPGQEHEKLHKGPHVSWSYPLASTRPIDSDLPNIVYAQWADSSHEYQEKHFGLTVMTDSDLDDFCRWRQDLTAPRQREWDTFVESLSPEDDIVARLKAFRFSDEAPREPGPDESPGIQSKVSYSTVYRIVNKIEELQKESNQ